LVEREGEGLLKLVEREAKAAISQSGLGLFYRGVLVGSCDLDRRYVKEAFNSVSDWHLSPEAILPGAASIIAIFVAFSEAVVSSNRGGMWSSRLWAEAYVRTNRLLADLSGRICGSLRRLGWAARALAPTGDFDEQRLASSWSHKLVGSLCGLGVLGLHRMLITPLGCAGRITSVVTNARLATDRSMCEQRCDFFEDRSCVECVQACPVGAITEEGFDAAVCYRRCLENAARFEDLGSPQVCGKCAVVRCATLPSLARPSDACS